MEEGLEDCLYTNTTSPLTLQLSSSHTRSHKSQWIHTLKSFMPCGLPGISTT
jgi:hypothetical protein